MDWKDQVRERAKVLKERIHNTLEVMDNERGKQNLIKMKTQLKGLGVPIEDCTFEQEGAHVKASLDDVEFGFDNGDPPRLYITTSPFARQHRYPIYNEMDLAVALDRMEGGMTQSPVSRKEMVLR